VRRWWIAGAIVAVAIVAAACSGSSGRDSDRASGGLSAQTGSSAGREADGGEAIRDGAGMAPVPGTDVQNGPPVSSDDAASGGGSSESYNNSALPQMLDRQIIRTALLTVNVEAVSQKFEEVSNIALGAGGFVSSSTFGNTGESQTASVTIRVPSDQYDATIRKLRGLGEVKEESSNANDVTEQYTDLQSRLRNLRASEERYLDLLTRAQNIDEILTVQDRINATRAEIEQVQGRIQMLDNQSSLATITVHLLPPPAAAPKDDSGTSNPLEVAQEAFDASLNVLLGIATVAVAVAAFSWWLVPLAAGGLWLGRRQVRGAR
jgi:hypothetical protein